MTRPTTVSPYSQLLTGSTPISADRSKGSPFPNQAFRVTPRAYGVQFHPEVTADGFRRWQDAPWARYSLPGAQTREEQTRLLALHDAAQAAWFEGFLTKLFGTA